MAETKRQAKERLLKTFKMLTALNYRVEEAIRVNEPLDTRDWDALVALSQSRAIETQLNVLAAALENCEEELNKVWVELARDSYHDFYEFMNREEEYVMSPHQRLIGDLLMASASKETMRFMLSMPPGHCKPVWEEELITMGDGTQRPLKDIRVGDTVVTSQGRARRVEGVWEQGDLPEWVIETESGRKISAACDHPFLTPRGWVNVQDLRLTDSLAGAVFDQEDHPERRDEEFALAGYLIGDGSVTDNNCNFTNADPAIWDDFDRCISSLGFEYGGVYQRGRATTKRLNGGAKAWCRAAGIDGLNSHTKRVPAWVFEGSNRQIGIFIAAYWDCDGSVHKKGRSGLKTTAGEDRHDLGIELVSVSSALLADIRLLFTRMGIRSLLRERQNPHAYRLRVGPEEACALFKQFIPLKGEKRERLTQWDPSLQFMGPYLGDRIVALSVTGQRFPMRCLTVEEDHSFLVQGMVVHNSTHSSHHFPAWWFGKFPKLKFLQAGHSQDFVANELGAKVKSIIDSDDYRLVFPEVKLRTDMRAKDYWGLSNLKGKYVAKGAGQGISGFRGNYGMVDDPYKSRADAESATIRDRVFKWYSDDFSTRLLPGSPLGIIMTRWHSDDLCGRISDREEREQKEEEARQKEQQISQLIENLEEQKGNQKKYRFEIINLPAICEDLNDPLGRAIGEALWDELFDLAALENLKADMTSASWNSLYQGTPIDAEGGAISGDWFQRYEKAPSRGDEVTANEVRRCVVSVDAANTAKERSDFTVITVWYEDFKKNHYLIDVVRKQMEFPEMSAEIARVCRRYNADALLIEAKGNGLAYLQQKKDGGAPAPLIPIEVGTASKEFRFDEVTPMIEGGQVYLPTRAIWLADFEKELISFPFGKNDDQVDSTSQYLKWARHKGRRGTKKLGGTGHRTRSHA